MANLKRILIVPYFGDLPEWWDKFEFPKGYEVILDRDLEDFKNRVRLKLNIEYPSGWGSSKLSDYRSLLGYLYQEEIEGYDYWGHCDLDMIFGDVDRWFPDSELKELDVWSNHNTYICGCWTLYRNCDEVNQLFLQFPNWQEYLIKPEVNGWIEKEFSRFLEQSGLRYRYSFFQGDPYTTTPNLRKTKYKLYQFQGLIELERLNYRPPNERIVFKRTSEEPDGIMEIPMFHFRRSKKWPL